MADIEIGIGKSARRAYSLDEVAIGPSRRTRDPEGIDLSWQVDAFPFELPLLGSACDSVTLAATAIAMGEVGAAGVLHLEGLGPRYEDADEVLAEIADPPDEKATVLLQEVYAAPINP